MAIGSVSGQGRQFRFALSAFSRQMAFRYHASLLYRWRYTGAVPERLLIAPIDLRTADPTTALDIYAGRFYFSGEGLDINGYSVFDVDPPSDAWARELHGFGWLRHLRATDTAISRSNARSLVEEWIEQAGKVDPIAMETGVTARRVISWLAQAPLILDGCDLAFYRRFMRSLTRQVRYLRRTAYDGPQGMPRLRVMIALTSAALSMSDQTRFLKQASKWLDQELVRQILPDGGHISRNPAAILELLLDLLPLRQAFTARGVETSRVLLSAIDRMMPMLRYFRQGDGSFARFNGAGDTPADQLATVLAYDDVRGAPLTSTPHSGYQRVEAGTTIMIVDAGRPPPTDFSVDAHAGCLSFEMSSGRQRLIINCGVPFGSTGPLHRLARTTAAHSTVSLNDTSQCRFLARSWIGDWLGEAVIAGPTRVKSERRFEAGATILEMGHNGYVSRYAIVHERQLALSDAGDRLDGLDMFLAPNGKPISRSGKDAFAIRFHLHPNVQVTQDSNGISLALPDGETWAFATDGPEVEIEESILMSNSRGNRQTSQIVVHGRAQHNPAVSWQLQRVAVGGRRRALAPPRQREAPADT
ncbi:heparinase II/III family protein [Bauldia sp.]|uniref:heparinase II/III family protein n=1 Tax=Bauldia sp. TaxID=2575872 RepID=UPI003BAA2606